MRGLVCEGLNNNTILPQRPQRSQRTKKQKIYHREAVKKLRLVGFFRDFAKIFNFHPHSQRPGAVLGGGEI